MPCQHTCVELRLLHLHLVGLYSQGKAIYYALDVALEHVVRDEPHG